MLDWLAAQPWCNGRTGMMGISWGGFNALQVAARRPPSLRAIVTVSFTDDRYADDMHYMGGCLLTDNLVMGGRPCSPTTPARPTRGGRRALAGDVARAARGSGPWLDEWLRHQRRDDYWRHGSVCEDYSAIQCPVLAVSGWADGYTNAVFRLLAAPRRARARGSIGPWSHMYPAPRRSPGPPSASSRNSSAGGTTG